MSDETNMPSLLDEDLSQVDPSMPLLKEGIYTFEVKDIVEKQSEGKDSSYLKITLGLLDENAMSVKGEPINKGFPLFHNIGITPTDKYSVEAVKRSLAGFTQAIGVKSIKPFDNLKGKPLKVKVKVSKERTDEKTGRTYPEANEVKMFVPVA